MSDDSYSLKEMIQEFRDDINKQLGIIDTKVTNTNGRVKKLELQQAYLKGIIAAVTILVIPVLISAVQQYINKKVDHAVMLHDQQEYK